MIKICVVGITGRMGQQVCDIINNSDKYCLFGGVSSKSDLTECEDVIKNSDVIIDFSNDAALSKIIPYCVSHSKPIVSGTTALSDLTKELIANAAKKIPFFYASNFCIAIHLMAAFTKKSSNVLHEYDVSILDTHHKAKKDSPSGTAIFLAENAGVGKDKILDRRCGKIVGEHVVTFFGEKDKLQLLHEAYDRSIFAEGAVSIVEWILNKKNGYFSMKDFLESSQC